MSSQHAYHDRFVSLGKRFDRLAAPFAKLDLPDRLSLPSDRPILFAGNHRSLFDFIVTMVVFSRFERSSRLLIRADFVNEGVPGRILRSIGAIATSRALAADAEDQAVKALLDGELVAIMPEGRLMKPAEYAEFGVGNGRPGVSRIARRAGAVVMPVGFVGTENVWPRNGYPLPRWPRPTATLRLGPPVELDGDDHQANTETVMEALGRLVQGLEAGASPTG